MEEFNSVTTQLLTLLNVSATKSGKRKCLYDEILPPPKLNKRKSVRVQLSEVTETSDVVPINSTSDKQVKIARERNKNKKTENTSEEEKRDGNAASVTTQVVGDDTEKDNKDEEAVMSAFQVHFGIDSPLLTESSRKAVDEKRWTTQRDRREHIGSVVSFYPEGYASQVEPEISDKIAAPFRKRQGALQKELKTLQDTFLSEISTYRDFFLPRLTHEHHPYIRDATTLHIVDHVSKKRRRILKNNEKIAHTTKDDSTAKPAEIRDQGFTRPSVLILLPFRSWALRWVESLIAHTPKPNYQIENHARFLSEYGLPEGAVDKLEAASAGSYPFDHIDMFKGNIDDSFRLGIKLTKKSVKLFSDFYQCDVIVASPLGLRMSIEKEKNADFLSSIDILIVDQLNALNMQNWEHLQFVLSNLNSLPKETRDTDFSRIKPWYLDGYAAYLRQTIMFSPHETPEFRHLFNQSLKNVGGKERVEGTYSPLQVPEGISQIFVSFACGNNKEEADKRFQYFSTKTLPTVMKSAVQSAKTLVFIPSSFDFIRVENHFRKTGASFAVLSEYSSNQDISRARQAFFSEKVSFLLMSERFYFYRRYKIRGIRNILFYGLPDHSQFYSELLSFPFLDEGVEASDITCKALFCKYDWMRLERISGTDSALELIKQI